MEEISSINFLKDDDKLNSLSSDFMEKNQNSTESNISKNKSQNKLNINSSNSIPTSSVILFNSSLNNNNLLEKLKSTAIDYKFDNWKLTANISSKIISWNDETVLLECLIDREENIYEERYFPINLFHDYKKEKGAVFKICTYERNNQMMIEVKNIPELILETDFPSIDFYSEFKTLKLNKNI